jgi:hypothetical protein
VGRRLFDGARSPARRLAVLRTVWAYGVVRLRLRGYAAGRALAWSCRPRPGRALDPDTAWWSVQRLVRRGGLPGTCLVRSLVLARVLAIGGRQPSIRLGVRSGGPDVRAHAWVEMDGRTYGREDGFYSLSERPGARSDRAEARP